MIRALKTRIGRARELAGLSADQAAKILGVDREWLARVEVEQEPPTEEFLRRVADLMGTTMSWLLGDEPMIPAATTKLLRDSDVTPRDRDTLIEVIGMWCTPDEVRS